MGNVYAEHSKIFCVPCCVLDYKLIEIRKCVNSKHNTPKAKMYGYLAQAIVNRTLDQLMLEWAQCGENKRDIDILTEQLAKEFGGPEFRGERGRYPTKIGWSFLGKHVLQIWNETRQRG